jgi:hypothetical protein
MISISQLQQSKRQASVLCSTASQNQEYDITCLIILKSSRLETYKIYLGRNVCGLLQLRVVVGAALAVAAAMGIVGFYISSSEDSSGAPAREEEARRLALGLEEKMGEIISVMKSTAMEQEVRNTGSLSLVSTAQMGIPEDADSAKRQVAKSIMAQHSDFASIFFLTPDGNLYMGEPFEQQKQLPRLNYSDRDWYQGVSSTNDAYTSAVFMSAAINEPAVAVAVPVYAQGAGNSTSDTIGYWVAIVNVEAIGNTGDVMQGSGNRVIFVDHNGNEIADSASDPLAERTQLQSFSTLQSVKAALAGESGSIVETVDGKSVNVSYAPLSAHPHTWAAILVTGQ